MFRSSRDITNVILPPVEVPSQTEEYFHCTYCNDGGWTSETEVDIHKVVVHSNEIVQLLDNKKNVCKVCLTLFRTEEELKEHILTEHFHSSSDAYRVERQIFICDVCSVLFFNKLQLEIHIQHNHLDLSKDTCVQCPKCGHSIKLLNIWFHFQSHRVQSVSSCRICLTKCKNRRHLREHMKTHPKYLNCELCSYDAKRDVLFKDHIKNRHKQNTNIVNLANKDYDKYFIPKLELAWKIQTKTNYNGLQIPNGYRICILCREICKDKQSRRNHILAEHNMDVNIVEKKEYKCVCGEVFTTKVLLKHHVFKLKGEHQSI